jgi:hypothetical protein
MSDDIHAILIMREALFCSDCRHSSPSVARTAATAVHLLVSVDAVEPSPEQSAIPTRSLKVLLVGQ